jgi:hypothetical protein
MKVKTTSWNKRGSWNSFGSNVGYYCESRHVLQPCTDFKVKYQQRPSLSDMRKGILMEAKQIT